MYGNYNDHDDTDGDWVVFGIVGDQTGVRIWLLEKKEILEEE